MKNNQKMTYILSILGCVLMTVMILYFGISLYLKMTDTEPAVSNQVVQQGYTQEELDHAVQEAIAQYEVQMENEAGPSSADEVLQTLKTEIKSGTTLVQALRKVYKDEIVLASGGEYHFVPISDTLAKNDYKMENLSILENGELQYYVNDALASHKGIDVSKHNGTIDWQKVADDGVEFAFIRVGNRGYGVEGKLLEDTQFDINVADATKAGIKVGVYFYSQAITEAEVLEEAELVLRKIAPYQIDCPIVYDVEKVSGADGRMNNISVEERTRFTKLFCETIEKAGYKPMVYLNMEMGTLMLDLAQLEEYDKWFAYYNQDFYFPYAYKAWQYSDKGRVNGITGEVDLNIAFEPLWD